MENVARSSQPHVVLLTFPSTGHTNPMLQFAKNITKRGVFTTLVTFSHAYSSLLQATESLAKNGTRIQAESIPIGLPADQEIHYGTIAFHTTFNFDGSDFESLINKLNSDNNNPPVCYIVYNHFIPWARKVALKLGIRHAMFWTMSATVFSIYHYTLFNGDTSLSPVEKGKRVPGLELVMQESDLPSSFTAEMSNKILDAFKIHLEDADKLSWVLANTFYELEQDAFEYIRSQSINFAGIGPCLPTSFMEGAQSDLQGRIQCSHESGTCINWLNSQPENSVMYISFGSVSVLSKTQVEELAIGIKQSGHRFLWIVRGMDDMLPHAFVEETKDRGLLVKWSNQLEVLLHPSVGGYLSHCGWSSTLESICAGVPIAAFAIWTDQPVNSKMICDKWKIGIRLQKREDGIVGREEVERCIRGLLSEDAIEKRNNIQEWKERVREAVSDGQSFDCSLSAFVEDVVKEVTRKIGSSRSEHQPKHDFL